MKGLIFTYAMVAFGVLGAFWAPALSLFVYIGFAVLRPEFLWGFAGDLTRVSFIVGFATVASWILRGTGSWRFGRGRTAIWVLLFYAGWTVLSALTAQDSALAMNELMPMVKLVLPIVIGATVLEERDATALLWIVVITQGYIALEMNDSYFLYAYNRAQDGFGGMDGNCFGISLVTVIGLAAAMGLAAKSWWARGLAFLATVLILHATLLTFSRGAFVGLVVVGVVALVLMPKRPTYLAAVLALGLLTVRLMGPEVTAKINTTFASSDTRDASAQSRLDLWAECITVMERHPLLGVGPGNWPIAAREFGWSEGKQAHSTWMQTGAELGVPGVLSLLLFYLVTGLKLWPILRNRSTLEAKRRSTVAVGIILAIVGYIVSAMFVSLEGLEVPYYITLAGVVLMKRAEPGLATAAEPARLGRATTGSRPARTAAAPRPVRALRS
jgi:putative inorganic carbon (HCO3(-)) transporter